MKRKISNYLRYTVILLCLITISFSLLVAIRHNNKDYSSFLPNSSVAFTPIEIDGNTELDAWAAVNSPGTDGLSWGNAHIIENYEIDATGTNFGISITNIDRYLIIRNCDVSNALFDGISISSCQNIEITACDFHDNTNSGIRTPSSNNIIISDNTALRNKYGIVLWGLDNSDILDNIVKKNLDGFDLIGCNNLTLSGNVANNNDWTGIFISDSDNNTLSDNTVANNINYGGIYLDSDCDYNEVYDNIVCSNNPTNILDEGQNNNIYSNTLTCPKEETIPGYSLVYIITFIMTSVFITGIKFLMKKKEL